jgi:hypothetical protein
MTPIKQAVVTSRGEFIPIGNTHLKQLEITLSNDRVLTIELFEREPGTIECFTPNRLVLTPLGGYNAIALHPLGASSNGIG